MFRQRLMRIGLSCRRFGVMIVPVLNIHIRCIEASLQDGALKVSKLALSATSESDRSRAAAPMARS